MRLRHWIPLLTLALLAAPSLASDGRSSRISEPSEAAITQPAAVSLGTRAAAHGDIVRVANSDAAVWQADDYRGGNALIVIGATTLAAMLAVALLIVLL